MIRRGTSDQTPWHTRRPLDVAIIGMACRFPGADTLEEFWRNILDGRRCTTEIPPSRWNPDAFDGKGLPQGDGIACRHGGFLREPVEIRAAELGVMPATLEGGEPEQYLTLDTARAALEDAGLGRGVPDGRRVEVIVGRGNYFNRGNLTRLQHGRILAQTLSILKAFHPDWTDEEWAAVRSGLKSGLPPMEASTLTGQLTNGTAGRLAERLNLQGASYVVDAASGSSLVALDLAARSLASRRSDLALVGGVYIAADVDFYQVFQRLGALTSRERARPFAADADGLLPGEGVGVVVLKRRVDAERDGDRIYAVLKSVGVASDGRSGGLASPSAAGHVRAMRRAYRSAGLNPASVGLVEAHALGVPASDRAELRALSALFGRGAGEGPVLGAVSSQIGHAMPAAGMAGLIKVALSLHHRILPPSLPVDRPHRLLSRSSLEWNTVARPWIHGVQRSPRRAAVNAFGFAGVNAHAVLEEHPRSDASDSPGCLIPWETEAILLGAEDRPGLIAVASALLDWLQAGANRQFSLKDLAATLNTGQRPFPVRAGLVVRSPADLIERLGWLVERLEDPSCLSIRDGRGTYYWSEPLAAAGGKVALVFPGEGAQYPGMLADLCLHFPEVRDVLDNADRIAQEGGNASLPSRVLFGGHGSGSNALWSIDTAVNVVLSGHWGLKRLLDRLGIAGDVVVGHSSGEILALASAGVIASGRDLESRLAEMSACFAEMDRSARLPAARLVAVSADRATVESLCAETVACTVAMDNCPHQVVVAGPIKEIDQVLPDWKRRGFLCELLPFERAYHTPQFAEAIPPLRQFYDDLPLHHPVVPVYSCATGRVIPADVEIIRDNAVEQWTRPVEFAATVERMHADGVRLFVEVGARGNLTGCIDDILRGHPHFAVCVNLPRRSGLTQLNHLVASLYAQGVPVRAEILYSRRRPLPVDLSRDLPQLRRGEVLQLAFPEMRLPSHLVERLATSRDVSANASAGRHIEREDKRAIPASQEGGDAQAQPSVNVFQDSPCRGGQLPASSGPREAAILLNSEGRATNMSESDALSYFQTMDLFLETQRQVVEAYLGRGNPTPRSTPMPEPGVGVDAPVNPSCPTTLANHEARSAPATAVLATSPAVPTVQDQSGGDVEDILLGLVQRRTGYPREVLDLNNDMEADLGIDSIKRVEILGELQDQGWLPEGVGLDDLTRSRTLGDLVRLLVAPKVLPAQTSSSAVGNWPGRILVHEPGSRFVGTWPLDATTDPVARHHTLGGRRISALNPERLGIPVVPFTVMAEMLAQAASVLQPGRYVTGLRQVQANRWLPFPDRPGDVELHATLAADRPNEVRVALRTVNLPGIAKNLAVNAVFEGTIDFADTRPDGVDRTLNDLPSTRRCRLSARELYEDQWLFHGEALRALSDVGVSCPEGIDGTITVLPREPLLPATFWGESHTDPIVLDAFTHLLGAWGIDEQAGVEGDVMFPLRVDEIQILGNRPNDGSAVACRIRVRDVTRQRVRVDAELDRPDGSLWMRLVGWEDWRFYWPNRVRDVFRAPDRVFPGEPLPLQGSPLPAVCVWLEPPGDMSRPIWSDVFEWVSLDRSEIDELRARGTSATAMMLSAWGRIAVKEACRRLWESEGRPPVYPADLVIEHGSGGQPLLRARGAGPSERSPSISIAHTEGVAIGLACLNPDARVGVDVERIEARPPGFESLAFNPEERAWLDNQTAPGEDRDEWVARLWCAKEAAAKSSGLGMTSGPVSMTIQDADRRTGCITVTPSSDPARSSRESVPRRLNCHSARRGTYVWAWTITEGTNE